MVKSSTAQVSGRIFRRKALSTLLQVGKYDEFSKKGWHYWRCTCGHVFVDPLPSDAETRKLYDTSYSDQQLQESACIVRSPGTRPRGDR